MNPPREELPASAAPVKRRKSRLGVIVALLSLLALFALAWYLTHRPAAPGPGGAGPGAGAAAGP
ncbi:efflux RND transporter periplasmic adaptor subunit, partial [Oxalobacteraceae bacterium OM1]